MAEVKIFLTVSDSSPWEVPADFDPDNNTVECVGAGAGGYNDGIVASGGGGAGAYSKKSNLALSGSINFVVPAGGQNSFSATDTHTDFNDGEVTAECGLPSTGLTGGLGGLASNSVGTVKKNGGNGGNSTDGSQAGSGGGAGGNINNGDPGGDDEGYGGGNGEDPQVPGSEGSFAGADGQPGICFDASHGTGSGAGAGTSVSGSGGQYGGGAGGWNIIDGQSGIGGNGLIVITYEPLVSVNNPRGFFAVL